MITKETIRIRKIIVHILDATVGLPVLSDTELEFGSDFSDFVKEQVGVDNVCERAALRGCRYGGTLVYKKHAEDGMTIAIAKREWRVGFNEE